MKRVSDRSEGELSDAESVHSEKGKSLDAAKVENFTPTKEIYLPRPRVRRRSHRSNNSVAAASGSLNMLAPLFLKESRKAAMVCVTLDSSNPKVLHRAFGRVPAFRAAKPSILHRIAPLTLLVVVVAVREWVMRCARASLTRLPSVVRGKANCKKARAFKGELDMVVPDDSPISTKPRSNSAFATRSLTCFNCRDF